MIGEPQRYWNKIQINLKLRIDEYYRYEEPSWDERRINNINQHFVTAFLGMHLKQLKAGLFTLLRAPDSV